MGVNEDVQALQAGLTAGSYDIPLVITFTAATAMTASAKVTLVVS